MKDKLGAGAGRRLTFVANFDRLEHQGRETTVRLSSLRLSTGEVLAERAHVPYAEAFGHLGLDPGDVVQFDAYAEPAARGGDGRLTDPGQLKKLPFDLWRGLVAGGMSEVAAAQRPGLERLTGRERQVLEALGEGRTVTDIAASWVVSESTVRSQVRGILTKLGVTSQLEAVALALRVGWLRAPDLGYQGGVA